MGKYMESNLVRYEKAIVLHFDSLYEIAWLTLENYGLVFHKQPWVGLMDVPKKVTIGIPAGSFTQEEALLIAPIGTEAKLTADRVRHELRGDHPFSISANLDVFEVIAFQLEVLELAYTHSEGGQAWAGDKKVPLRSGHTRRSLFGLLQVAFRKIGIAQPAFDLTAEAVRNLHLDRRNDTSRRLGSTLSGAPAARWIAEQIEENAKEDTGLVAFFPMPHLIVQEQRTRLIRDEHGKPMGEGKTNNQDMRLIEPLYGRLVNKMQAQRNSKDFSFEAFLDAMDRDREANLEAFRMKNPSREFALNPSNFPQGSAYLHKHLDRINCYAFRGESRGPGLVKAALGLLPGITRRDEGVKAYEAVGKQFDQALFGPDASVEKYHQLLGDHDVFTLGVYTVEQSFKGYISTTKSTAMAKCLAGKYAAIEDKSKFCYAVRCKQGFHLPSDVVGKQSAWKSSTDAKNAFTHFAEQEVAVPGAIFWEDVCGMRVIKLDANGPVFTGPVFLKTTMRSDWKTSDGDAAHWIKRDDDAFSEFFELLSGKSQGPGFEIEWSYDAAPFDCPGWLMDQRQQLEQ